MTLNDQQNTIISLTLAAEGCNTALASISDILSQQTNRDNLTDHAILYKDFVSLLSLLRGSTTKLSLALKPSSPTYSASLAPLRDISIQVSALSHCVGLFSPGHGTTLIQEVCSFAKDVIESIRALLQAFLDVEAKGMRASTGQAGDVYMVRTGAVHDLIDKALASGGVSDGNLASVRKRWAQDYGSLEDGLREVGEMIEAAQSATSDDGEESGDDGWKEIGLDYNQKMNGDELERAQKVVHAVLCLSTLLHKRVLQDILFSDVGSSHASHQLDMLPPLSSDLLTASDELISVLYAPPNPADIVSELATFQDVVHRLRSSVHVFFPESPLDNQLGTMSLTSRKKDPKKWFDTCFDQIQKAIQALKISLELDKEI